MVVPIRAGRNQEYPAYTLGSLFFRVQEMREHLSLEFFRNARLLNLPVEAYMMRTTGTFWLDRRFDAGKMVYSEISVITIIVAGAFFLYWILNSICVNKAYPAPVTSSSTGSFYTTAEKTCDACGRSVPLSSQEGQRCPHCGAYWGDERQIYRD